MKPFLRRTAGLRRAGPLALLLALLPALNLAGCSTSSPPPVLLTLPPANTEPYATAVPTATAAASAAPTAARVLAVRRVTIPEYLVARHVRFRADPSTLAEWPNTYWAERIEIGVSREFVSALRQQLPDWELCDTGCGDQTATLALQLDLVPMDYLRSAGKLQARGRITLSEGGVMPSVLLTRELPFEVSTSADSAQGQAEAITKLIRQAARSTAPLVRAARP